MAVDAVHPPNLELFHLLRREGQRAVEIFGDPPLAVFDPDPRNFLPLRIARAVPHLIADVHVPVDAGGDAGWLGCHHRCAAGF